jgi:hypothetical protein
MVRSRKFALPSNPDPKRLARIQGVLKSVKGFVQRPPFYALLPHLALAKG